MIFTLEHVLNSLAGVLKAGYPEWPVYTSANQQGTKAPCFFLFFLPSSIEDEMNDRFLRDLGVDIVYVQQRNIVNGNERLREVAEYLDEALELFAYSDESGGTALVRTYEREWSTEDEELHYKFHIRQRVSLGREPNLMREMEENRAVIRET